MSPRPININEKLATFDRLPDDAIIDDQIAAILLNMHVATLRRANPIPQRRISERRFGRRAGDIRNLIRGNAA